MTMFVIFVSTAESQNADSFSSFPIPLFNMRINRKMNSLDSLHFGPKIYFVIKVAMLENLDLNTIVNDFEHDSRIVRIWMIAH